MRRRQSLLVVAAATLFLSACGIIPGPPPALPDSYVPDHIPPASQTEKGNLTPYGFSEAQRMAVRVRNVGCSTVTRGTGFALDDNTLITNRHVVDDAKQLQLNTYDGKDVSVTSAAVAGLADLALVRTEERLEAYPVAASDDPEVGEQITIVGYPNGGALTVTSGTILKYTQDPLNQNLGKVIYSDAMVEHGSSGSAVLNEEGVLVGVVYAKNTAGSSYIIPVSTLMSTLQENQGFETQELNSCA